MPSNVHVLVVQTAIIEAAGSTAEDAIAHNLHRAVALIEKAAVRNGAPDIVVLPEFFLTGMASTRPHDECMRIARTIPGAETAVLGALAQRLGCYIAGAAWERDDAWPDRFFNGAFIIGPSGDVELRYRKLNEGNFHAGVTGTTPADVLDEYEEKVGRETLFPVLDTPHGVLGCVICNDVNYPETVRQLVLRGADIILHPTGEPNGGYLDLWQATRVTRALENHCFWVSANHGPYRSVVNGDEARGAPVPDVLAERLAGGLTAAAPTLGDSQVVGPRGEVLGRLGQGEGTLDVWLDVDACRAGRVEAATAGWPLATAIAGPRVETLAAAYDDAPGFPSNVLAAAPLRSAVDGFRMLGEITTALDGSAILPTTEATAATVLAFGADVTVLASSADDRALAAAIVERVAASRVALLAEVERVGASIVVLPQGWPAVVAGSHPGIDPDGAILDPVRELATELGVHLATALPVRGPNGRRREGLLVDPDGALVLRHPVVVPTARGYEADDVDLGVPVGAVVDTPFGRIGMIVGRELVSVEAVRLQAFAGAELLLHPSHELDAWAVAPLRAIARTRAAENAVWIATAHPASLLGAAPGGASVAGSVIHDDTGTSRGELPAGRSAGVSARFDALAQRQRRRIGATSKLVQLRSSIYGPAYRAATTEAVR